MNNSWVEPSPFPEPTSSAPGFIHRAAAPSSASQPLPIGVFNTGRRVGLETTAQQSFPLPQGQLTFIIMTGRLFYSVKPNSHRQILRQSR